MEHTYTNKFNLPPEIVKVLTRDRYTDENDEEWDYSATTIVAPIQKTILERRHPGKLRIFDIIDNFWAFVGSIAHAVLEEHAEPNAIIEKRFYAMVLGKKIAGKTDHYLDHVISDYKSTKVYKIIRGDYEDWEKQLNIYALLAAGDSALATERLRIIAFILDWKAAETYKKDYPKCPIIEIPLRLWSVSEQQEYLISRVKALIEAETLPDDQLPECSMKEMWQDVKDYAIMKEGGKRAVKVYLSEKEALTHKLKDGEMLLTRKTPRRRCLNHCAAAPVCQQHQRLLREENCNVTECPSEDPIF